MMRRSRVTTGISTTTCQCVMLGGQLESREEQMARIKDEKKLLDAKVNLMFIEKQKRQMQA